MKTKDTAIKEVKGYSSAYPHICNLKLLPNVDGTWITIQDDVGTSITVKLSDLSNYMYCEISNAMIKAEIMRVIDVRNSCIPSDENDYDELIAFADQVARAQEFEAIPIEVLNKIRERIELEKLGYPPSAGYYKAIVKVLQIIDKCRADYEV